MTGILFGVGLGPGSPDLITLRASRLIRNCRVLVFPQPEGGSSFARGIAQDLIPQDIVEIPVVIPMQEDLFPVHAVYDNAASRISGHLDAGEDVIVLCQGDPLFYGSFMYIHERLAHAYRVEIVPGVSSLTACAAVAGRPLCSRSGSLHILPATMGRSELISHIGSNHSCAIVKVGRHLPKIRSILGELGRATGSILVIHASMPTERMHPLESAPDNPPYFSTILVSAPDASE